MSTEIEGVKCYEAAPTKNPQEELEYMSKRVENLKMKIRKGAFLRPSMKRNLMDFFKLTEVEAEIEIDKFAS